MAGRNLAADQPACRGADNAGLEAQAAQRETGGGGTMILLYPIGSGWPITQTYDEHVQAAQEHGWCYHPGSCPSGVYYYGGIDWGCPQGTPVRASADGLVKKVARSGIGYGRAVYLLHADGFTTIYAHLSEINVVSGQNVKAGDLIGLSGNTGNSTGPHLHFELRDERGYPVDPAPYLGAETDIPETPTSGALWAIVTVNLRNAPIIKPDTKVGQLKTGQTIESAGEIIEADGRRWYKCIVYAAADYLEPK
jgi:murein DD-endopeptidase MepM/ murein hydrolase activator NlpD